MSNQRRKDQREETDVVKGLVAGLVGGLVASLAMNGFQALTSKVSEEIEKAQDDQKAQKGRKKSSGGDEQKEGDDATVKAAAAISESVFDHKLTKSEKKVAGPAVHFAFGTATGGFYGALAEVAPLVSTGVGLPFGVIFWLTADEAAVPALGLSKPPTEYPLSTHANALASHLVYGLTTDLVRRAVRNVL